MPRDYTFMASQPRGLRGREMQHDCDFPALPVKTGLLYTLPSPLFAQDAAIILADKLF